MDKLRAITVYRRVIELGSFTAAAEDLNLSKAAISKNIKELEKYLGSPLINRTTRTFSITDDGQNYFHHIRNILDDLSNADLAIRESRDSLKGVLRITAPMSFGLRTINSAICEFMKLYPEINVELVLNDQYEDVIAGGFDIAIRGGGTLKDSSLKQRKLLMLKRVLCASPEYIDSATELVTPEDLAEHNCLIYSLSSSPTHWSCAKAGKHKIVSISLGSYTVNNGLALTQAAVAGLGIILMPEILIKSELKSKLLVPLLPEWEFESHALYAIYPYHNETSHKLRTLIDFLVAYLTD